MALQLGPVLGKLGGGEVETTRVNAEAGDYWLNLTTLTVEKESLVAAVTSKYSTIGIRWGNPSPTIRLTPSDGRTPEPGVTEHWGAGATAEHGNAGYGVTENISVTATLPPGDYSVDLHMHGRNRDFTVESVRTSIVPLN